MNWLPALIQDMSAYGLYPEAGIAVDGEVHRFHVAGDRSGTKNGWYRVFSDHPPAAVYGSWKTGARYTWVGEVSGSPAPADPQSIRARKLQRDNIRREGHEAASKNAMARWAMALDADPAHAYLRGKAVGVHGIRQLGARLAVPLRDSDGRIWNLQTIAPDGQKRFLPGGRVSGLFHTMGIPERTRTRRRAMTRVWLCEGYATGASLLEDFGEPVVVAFTVGNLAAVTETVARQWKRVVISIMADDDWRTPGNPGMTAASAVAERFGARLHIPEFPKRRPDWATDYNDAARLWRTK